MYVHLEGNARSLSKPAIGGGHARRSIRRRRGHVQRSLQRHHAWREVKLPRFDGTIVGCGIDAHWVWHRRSLGCIAASDRSQRT